MKTFKNAASLIVAVSLMGLILIEQRAYQQSWSGGTTAPVASTDTTSAIASYAPGVETIVMK
ncbi:MAG TPA: hypothetical protein VKS22_01240 [Candidatus Binataceae bacterium]|nr:hypothetical protein [Candidatus Binataceae bacterium]